MSTIVIGARGNKVADHASSIDTLIKIDKNGNTKKINFKPKSSNPGQETMQIIDRHFSEAEAVIMGLMEGPPNSKRKIVHVEPEKDIKEVIEQYKKDKIYSGKKSYNNKDGSSESKDAEKKEYNTQKRDASGQGTRANKGRNPECSPEDYKETGQGSGTRTGRAAETSPQMKAHNLTTQNTIDNLVEKYSNAKTDKQKEITARAVGQYLREAADKNLKGKDAEKYVANKMKENGYSKNSNSSSSKKSGNSKTAKKAA